MAKFLVRVYIVGSQHCYKETSNHSAVWWVVGAIFRAAHMDQGVND